MIMDEPPPDAAATGEPAQAEVVSAPEADTAPIETREDGTIVIDLMSLAPPPEECVEEEPDPFNPEIIVCAKSEISPRLSPYYGPTKEDEFASAVPRARLKLSENAEAEANVIKKGVGGFDAEGGEVRVKIDF